MPDVPQSRVAYWARTSPSKESRLQSSRASTPRKLESEFAFALSSPGANVNVGDYIWHHGIELKAPDNIYRLLDGTGIDKRL